ncbi:MAG: hypothetical protein RXR41_06480 [Candidatus Marsarchaeota archaeon]
MRESDGLDARLGKIDKMDFGDLGSADLFTCKRLTEKERREERRE